MQRLTAIFLAALLSACAVLPQPHAAADNPDNLPRSEAAFLQRTAHLQQAVKGKEVQKTLYFDQDGNLSEMPVADGFVRRSYGLQDNGLYLMQDFYADGKKQTDLFYGTVEESFDSDTARGYLSTYTDSGRLNNVAYYRTGNDYRYLRWCGDGQLCLEEAYKRNDTGKLIYFDNGQKIAEFVKTADCSRWQDWYPNGQLATDRVNAEDADGENQETVRYYLEDGTPQSEAPESEASRRLQAKTDEIFYTFYEKPDASDECGCSAE